MSSFARQTRTLLGSAILIFLLAGKSLAVDTAAAELLPLAYFGPGAGLGAIGALLAVLGAAVLCIAGLVVYPLQVLRNRLSDRHEHGSDNPTHANPSS